MDSTGMNIIEKQNLWKKNSKMKILFINDYAEKAGGAEKHIYDLMKGLTGIGHEVRLLALGKKDEEKKNVHIRERRLSPRRLFFDRSNFVYLEELVKDFKPDILHLHNTIFFSLYFHYNLKNFKIPIVKTAHDLRSFCPSGWLMLPDYKSCSDFQGWPCLKNKCLVYYGMKKIEFIINILRSKIEKSRIDLVIAPSLFMKEILDKNKYSNAHCLPNFVLYHDVECKPYLSEKIILYIGRLRKEKGVHNLISAMKGVLNFHPEAKLFIAGGGIEEGNLRKQAKEAGIEKNVLFFGHTDDVKELYMKAYLIVIPSIWVEPFSLVALEAMTYGKAVVASRIGGLKDTIEDKKDGFLIKPNDVKELESAILRLLEDSEFVSKIGRGAKEKARKFDINIYLSKLLDMYKDVLHKRSRHI